MSDALDIFDPECHAFDCAAWISTDLTAGHGRKVFEFAKCVEMDARSREADRDRVRRERDDADERPDHERVAAAGRVHAHQGNEAEEQTRDRGVGDETGDTQSAVVATRPDRARVSSRERVGRAFTALRAMVRCRRGTVIGKLLTGDHLDLSVETDSMQSHQGPERPAFLSTVLAAAVPCVGSESCDAERCRVGTARPNHEHELGRYGYAEGVPSLRLKIKDLTLYEGPIVLVPRVGDEIRHEGEIVRVAAVVWDFGAADGTVTADLVVGDQPYTF
jgi:hypothetical protein